MQYVVRGNNGLIFTDCSIGERNGQEVEYSTYKEAEKVKKELQQSFKDIQLKVIEKKGDIQND